MVSIRILELLLMVLLIKMVWYKALPQNIPMHLKNKIMRLLVIFFIQGLMLTACTSNAQTYSLKSRSHAFDMMLGNPSKETLLEEMLFEHGKDANINVIRIDHIGENLYPLIISSKLPIASDSLGILSFVLQKDTLYNFLEMIDNVNPKMYTRKFDKILIRVTYRFEGKTDLYYVTNPIITTDFFKLIEKKLIDNKDQMALEKFYQFIAWTKLQVTVHGKRTWKY
jgi:hypothetical protein